jgi:hypothetical protein
MALTIYIKPTNFCSVGCEHCYLPEEDRKNNFVMTDETLQKAALLIVDLVKKEGHAGAHIIWHGGEPLMLEPDWFWNAGKILDKIIGKNNYTESLQTSLIPYKGKWKELIEIKFNSFIGSSIDFSQRKVKNNSDSYLTLWMKRVNRARADGFYIVPGMVPTKNEIKNGKQIVDWFAKNDFQEFNIERYSRYGNSNVDWPSNKEHSEFLKEIFIALMDRVKNNENTPYVTVIASAIKGVLFSQSGERWGGQCQKQFIVIEPDGSTNTCPDRAMHEKPFSNVNNGTSAFTSSEGRKKWIRIQNIDHKKSHCMSCEFQSWCKSGCPVTPNGADDGEKECSGYKTLLYFIKEFCNNEENRKAAIEYISFLNK